MYSPYLLSPKCRISLFFVLTNDGRHKAELWLRKIQESPVTKDLFAGFETKPPPERVRIAVLDTGYDPDAIFFQAADRRRRIRKWKDYAVGGSTLRRDVDGHGTHVLSLVMKVAPTADFYVARVARDTDDLSASVDNVAKVSGKTKNRTPARGFFGWVLDTLC